MSETANKKKTAEKCRVFFFLETNRKRFDIILTDRKETKLIYIYTPLFIYIQTYMTMFFFVKEMKKKKTRVEVE